MREEDHMENGEWGPSSLTSEARASAAELARLVAENAELRAKYADLDSMYDNHREGLEAELKDAEAERDRLRALVATGRALAEHVAKHKRAGFGLGDEEHRLAHERLELAEILIADPDGRAAAEWLGSEVERRVEAARIDMSENVWYCEECQRWQDRRSPCEADARFDEREKALAEMEAEKAKAGVEGRRQGLAEAAEYCQREAESLYRTAAGSVLAAVAKEIQALAEEGGK